MGASRWRASLAQSRSCVRYVRNRPVIEFVPKKRGQRVEVALLHVGRAPVSGGEGDCGLVAGEVVGRAFGVPFAFSAEGHTELPDDGWDQVIRWGHEDRIVGRTPTTMSALEIAFLPKARVGGSSLAMLNALRDRALRDCSLPSGRAKSIPSRVHPAERS